MKHGVRLRFVANAAFAGNITFQNLLDTLLMAATATTGYDLFYAVKVRAVEIWAEAILGSASTVSVGFMGLSGSSFGDQRLHTDTSMGVEPAHVLARPSPKSLAANFQPSSSAIALTMTVPSGAVVDLELTFVQSVQVQATAAQNALVGATAGGAYWRGLDGLASATSKFTPVVLATAIQ